MSERLAAACSWLFVPATRPKRIPGATASGAQAVIVDLEDAVAPADKAAARSRLAEVLRADTAAVLRINAAGTPWFDDDIAFAAQQPGIIAIVVPKAESVQTLQHIAAGAAGLALLPLIETARGIAAAEALASAAGVVRLLLGTLDLRLDLDLGEDDEALLHFRSHLVLASKLAGRASPVDGITTAIDDESALRADTARARRLGFGGKLCIHPRQVAIVNTGWRPTPEELAWAQRVVAIAEQGVAVLDGRMVDRPVIEQARRTLARHAAAGGDDATPGEA
jgi:citrate lyase subunit beta / citryl-CoA lyase